MSASRHFTAIQVTAYFQEHFVDVYNRQDEEIKVYHIALLDDVTPPVWIVDYRVKRWDGIQYHSYHTMLHITEGENAQKQMELRTASSTRLPENCASVEDEDTIIANYECGGW